MAGSEYASIDSSEKPAVRCPVEIEGSYPAYHTTTHAVESSNGGSETHELSIEDAIGM